jgi:Fungal protein kinase
MKIVDTVEFLERYLPTEVTQHYSAVIDSLSGDFDIRELLRIFCQTGGIETNRYQPFATLANAIMTHPRTLELLGGNSKLKFCRGDPKFLQGSIACRKPDVVLVRGDAEQLENSADLPHGPEPGFYWDEIYCYVEFKGSPVRGPRGTNPPLSLASPVRRSVGLNSPALPISRESLSSSNAASTSGLTSTKRPAEPLPSAEPEAKIPRTDAPNLDEQKQGASYALEMFSHGRFRTHVINITLNGAEYHLWYYHRGGIAVSRHHDLRSGPGFRYFVEAITRMACFTKEQWGFHPFILYPNRPLTPERETSGSRIQLMRKASNTTKPVYNSSNHRDKASPDPFPGSTITVGNTKIRLGRIVTRQYTLVGRGTIVVEGTANDPDLRGQDLMVKISWPSTDRVSEADIINAARACAAKTNNRAILDHIPAILRTQDYLTTPAPPHGGSTCTLRVIVMECFHPMAEIEMLDDFVKVIIDVVECRSPFIISLWCILTLNPGHQALSKEAKILHCDISQNNIMLRCNGGGQVHGILIDFDLATIMDPTSILFCKSPSLYGIMGTRPFMARDHLTGESQIHWERHDLESFFWLITIFIGHHHEGKLINDPPFKEWYSYNYSANTLAALKQAFLATVNSYHPTQHFKSLLHAWVQPLALLFLEGNLGQAKLSAAEEAGYDHETLGGLVTHRAFLAILKAEIGPYS